MNRVAVFILLVALCLGCQRDVLSPVVVGQHPVSVLKVAAAPMPVIAYHPTWWAGALKPSMIDFSALTHIIIFPAQDAKSTAPYFDGDDLAMGGDLAQIVTLAHAKGCKVLISAVGGYGQTVMPTVAKDAAKCQQFVNAAVAYAKAAGCDGVECDWEFPRSGDAAGWKNLITMFRTALNAWTPHGILIVSGYYSDLGNPPYVVSDINADVDFIVPMTYTMWMGNGMGPYKSGYDTPVNLPTQWSGYAGYSLSAPAGGGPLTYLSAGYNPAKVAVSISFEGTQFSGVGGKMGVAYSAYTFCSTVSKCLGAYAVIPASGRAWDATAQAAYCVSGNTVYSFQTPQSVMAIVSWAKTQGFGAIMIYDLGCGYEATSGASDPQALLHAVWNTAQGGILPITISSFGMTLVGGQAIATFTVLTEEAVYKYDIQRRPVGGQWTSRGSVFPFGAPHTYVFTDTSVPLGVWQYRIEEVDLDGETTDFSATAGLTDVIDKVGVVTHAIPQRSTK
jgi:Glycosyl hydrolases family 18